MSDKKRALQILATERYNTTWNKQVNALYTAAIARFPKDDLGIYNNYEDCEYVNLLLEAALLLSGMPISKHYLPALRLLLANNFTLEEKAFLACFDPLWFVEESEG